MNMLKRYQQGRIYISQGPDTFSIFAAFSCQRKKCVEHKKKKGIHQFRCIFAKERQRPKKVLLFKRGAVADLENFGGGGILSTKPQKFGCLHRN